MFTSREGFTIDVVALAIRKWILNPYLSVPLATALSWTSVVSWMRPGLIGNTPAASFTRARPASQILAVAGVLLYLNDYLNKQFANNWINPSKWNWDEEIVLLTGGSSGIGASIAQLLIAKNPRTRIVILDYAPLGWTPPANSRVQYFQCDLSDASVIREMCDKVRVECGHPTVLVNNAGLIRGRTLMEGTYGDVEATVRVNLIAPMLLAKEVLPEMVRRDHGHIVNLGSVSSLFAPAGQADYAATKAGLTAVHESLQLELANIHKAPRVRLTLGIFSYIRTPLIKGETGRPNFTTPLLHVDSVAEKLVEAIYSGYGQTIYMPGLFRYFATLRAWPEWYFRRAREESTKIKIDFRGRQVIDDKSGAILRG